MYTHNTQYRDGYNKSWYEVCVWEKLKTLEGSQWSLYLGGSHLAVLNGEKGGGGDRGKEKGRGRGTITQDKEQNLT